MGQGGQVTNVRVSFDRKRQPAQYESSGASVEFTAIIGDGEDHNGIAAKLLGEAKTLVLQELAIVAPGVNASVTAQAANTETAKAAKPGKAKKDAPVETRQISTGNERVDPAQAVSDIPDGSGAPAQVVQQTAAASSVDIPGDTPAQATKVVAGAPTGPTAEELHAYITGLVQTKKIDSATVKATSRQFGAEKIAQIAPDKLGDYKAAIDAAVANLAAAEL